MAIARFRTLGARLRGGRIRAAILAGIVGLAAACLAGPARAGELRVFSSGVQSDTLDADWREVFPIAVARLEHDDWAIERADTSARQVVTRWKPIDHALTRLTLGDVQARCVVDLAPLKGGRTIVRMRGALASPNDLEASPVWGTAKSTYGKAARKYLAGVRRQLERTTATASR